MKLSILKLKLIRTACLTVLTAVAIAALYSPCVAKADPGNADAKKDKKAKHREMTLEMSATGPCLKCKGNAGETYCIEATTDLVHPDWQPICAQTVSKDGQIEFTDTCASNYPARYYRMSWSSTDKQNNGNHYGTLKN